MTKHIKAALLSTLLFSTAAIAGNASDEFSPTKNPSGAWTYGWESSLGGTLNLYTLHQTWNGTDLWYQPITSGLAPGYPLIQHNPNAFDISSNGAVIPANGIVLHPGVGNQYSVLRWTASQAAKMSVLANFTRADLIGPTTTDVHIALNGKSIFDGLLDGNRTGASFNQLVQIAAGDTIDFAVGFGANRNYFYDATGLNASVASVPEPGSKYMFSFGIFFASYVLLRRRNSEA
jgi:hypothetical protein